MQNTAKYRFPTSIPGEYDPGGVDPDVLSGLRSVALEIPKEGSQGPG